MNEYQSKFTGEEIDELLQKTKNSSTNCPTTDDSALVTCYVDLTTMSVSGVSHTYQEICEMEQANKIINIKCDVNGSNQVYGTLTSVNYGQSTVFFQVIAQMSFGDGAKLYYFTLTITDDNNVYLSPYIITATALGG